MRNSGRVSGMIRKKQEQRKHLQSDLEIPEENEVMLRTQSSVDFQDKYVPQVAEGGAAEKTLGYQQWECKTQPSRNPHEEGQEACRRSHKGCQPPLCDQCSSIQKLQRQNIRLVERCLHLFERRHRLAAEISRLANQAMSELAEAGERLEELTRDPRQTIEEILRLVHSTEDVESGECQQSYLKKLQAASESDREIRILQDNLSKVKQVVLDAEEMFGQTKQMLMETSILDPQALRRDIDEIHQAITKKKLNTSIDDTMGTPPDHQQASQSPVRQKAGRTQQKVGHRRESINSDVTVFDINRTPPLRQGVEATSPYSEPNDSLGLNFTKKGATQYAQMQDSRSSKQRLICFSDKRPPKPKAHPGFDGTDELRMMLLLQARTIESLLQQDSPQIGYTI